MTYISSSRFLQFSSAGGKTNFFLHAAKKQLYVLINERDRFRKWRVVFYEVEWSLLPDKLENLLIESSLKNARAILIRSKN